MDHLKLISSQQAKAKHAYKNAKEKVHRTSAAVWLNKMFQLNHMTSNYIKIAINGHNQYLRSVLLQMHNTEIRVCTRVGILILATPR